MIDTDLEGNSCSEIHAVAEFKALVSYADNQIYPVLNEV